MVLDRKAAQHIVDWIEGLPRQRAFGRRRKPAPRALR